MSDQIATLNGFAPSWADVVTTLAVNGGNISDQFDYKALNWSSKLEIGIQRAPGGRIVRRTAGMPTKEASMTLYRSGLTKVLRALMAVAPVRGNQRLVGRVSFNLHIQFSLPDQSELYESKIDGCRLLGLDLSTTEGFEADLVEVPLNPVSIVEMIDGVEVVLE